MIESGIKRMLDLSTSHMTKGDAELMSDRHGHYCGSLPRIVQHAHEGFSVDLRAIYRAAALQGDREVRLINFDQDADVLEGLPTFDW